MALEDPLGKYGSVRVETYTERVDNNVTLLGSSVSLCFPPLFHSLMLLVHFFSDYANLNTSPSFCEETRLPFSASAPFAFEKSASGDCI